MARSSLSLTLYTPRFHDSQGSCGARGLLGGNVTQALRLNTKAMPSAARTYDAFHALSISGFSLKSNRVAARYRGPRPQYSANGETVRQCRVNAGSMPAVPVVV